MTFLFENRTSAGIQLANEIGQHDLVNPVLLALPRGGVPIAHEIFRNLGIPWEVLVTRKLGAPSNSAQGIGAISEDGLPLLTEAAYLREGMIEDPVADLIREEQSELQRTVQLFRQGKSLPHLSGRDVILVDDGLTTGITAAAAARYVQSLGVNRVILAVPVGPNMDNPLLLEYVDKIICLHRPIEFDAVRPWYQDYISLNDEDVLEHVRAKQQLQSQQNAK